MLNVCVIHVIQFDTILCLYNYVKLYYMKLYCIIYEKLLYREKETEHSV